jgi:hypothetical protein
MPQLLSRLAHSAPPPPGRIILRQREADVSGGNGIEADSSKFLTLHQSLAKDYATTIFWSRKAFAGKRLAIVDTPFNWRGDWYTTYLVGPMNLQNCSSGSSLPGED